jgi:hypothetical protein
MVEKARSLGAPAFSRYGAGEMITFRISAALFLAWTFVALGRPVLAQEPASTGAESAPAMISKVAATAVPTFHCLGIYWSPENGHAEKKVLVKFRAAGAKVWHDGLAMRYNPMETPECKGDYRGSIVNLQPGTEYEIALTLEGTEVRTSLKAATWSEKFPIASTVKCQSGGATLNVKKSGTPQGYILYDGAGCVIDGGNKIDLGIHVNASYVILRGFTIKNVKQHGIRIDNGHHIVIEDCDISKWGSEEEPGSGFGEEMHACVYSKHKDLHAVVIQRNKFHHPSWDSNSWAEEHNKGRNNRHPSGPQTIVFWETRGNNVIRYNECWSDKDHYYNDIIGGAKNGSYRGFPGADSDIYCNYFAHCWDDGIESEGGNQNVRIWNNYIEESMMMIANAATSIGPLYIWRNVAGRSYSPPGSSYDLTHGYFMKMGYADGEHWMTGHMYVFNNTLLQPNNEGPNGLGGESKAIKLCVSRNNILHVRPEDTRSISTDKNRSVDNDFDYDLLSARYPDDHEKHGIKGTPSYVPGAGFSFETRTGNFQLTADSLGFDKGEVISNFCEIFNGAAPDIGAHEAGTAPLIFGVKGQFTPPAASRD